MYTLCIKNYAFWTLVLLFCCVNMALCMRLMKIEPKEIKMQCAEKKMSGSRREKNVGIVSRKTFPKACQFCERSEQRINSDQPPPLPQYHFYNSSTALKCNTCYFVCSL